MSWRKATTAASKLPNDWEEQGLQMAMRIAAAMALHKVSVVDERGKRDDKIVLTLSLRHI